MTNISRQGEYFLQNGLFAAVRRDFDNGGLLLAAGGFLLAAGGLLLAARRAGLAAFGSGLATRLFLYTAFRFCLATGGLLNIRGGLQFATFRRSGILIGIDISSNQKHHGEHQDSLHHLSFSNFLNGLIPD